MAITQTLKVNFANETSGKKFSKSFSDIPDQTLGDTDDAKTVATNYKKIVDGTFTNGEIHTVEPFEA